MTQLILNAAASAYHGVIHPVVVDCDNNGFVSHGNAPLCSLPTNHTQADVLHTFKHLVSAQPFRVIFMYVQLHANDTKKWQDCTLKECINNKLDRLAKKVLKAAHSTRQFIKGTFLHKQIWITMGGKKVTGPLWSELEEFWGCSTAKMFFYDKGIILSIQFDSVWWIGYNQVSPATPKRFAPSQPSKFWMVRLQLKALLWEENIMNKCPQCGYKHENSKHLTQCRDPGWVLQLHNLSKPSWTSWMMQMLPPS
jgi:hypothetical protein